MEQMLSDISDMWRNKFAEQESWFKSENAKLLDQLKIMQERGINLIDFKILVPNCNIISEDLRWHQLKEKPIAEVSEDSKVKMPSFSAPPVPAARRRRIIKQPISTTVSKLEFPNEVTDNQLASNVHSFFHFKIFLLCLISQGR
jgi:hypothetical protein